MTLRHCAFSGCAKTVDLPGVILLPPEGWVWLDRWGPGVPDGLYCQPHAEALEALHLSGELVEAQRPARSARRKRALRRPRRTA